jgi:phosphoribosylanthranilate isomerase
VFIKICGITSEEDALLAVALGADAIGFVFAPSPRQIAPTKALDIVKRLPSDVITVGVFRDEHPKRVLEIARVSRLKGVQLHGNEPLEAVRLVTQEVRFAIKAVVAGSDAARRADEFGTDAVLVDNARPGSGEAFDWSLLDELPKGLRVMLSGGLSPDNVRGAILSTQPWGVDVSSGVERSPGVKDAVKMRQFITAARDAQAVLGDDLID